MSGVGIWRLVACLIVTLTLVGVLSRTGAELVAAQDSGNPTAMAADSLVAPTPIPTDTPTPEPIPTDTPTLEPIPTDAPTISPTDAPAPSPTDPPVDTPTVAPTDLPEPTATDTPATAPTDSPEPTATATDAPAPTKIARVARSKTVFAAAAGSAVLPLTLAVTPTTILAGATTAAQASWASITGGVKPTGAVLYSVLNGSGCTGTVFNAGSSKTMTTTGANGSVPASESVAFPAGGSYSWQAAYAGDAAYAPVTVCSNLTVTKFSPTVALTIAPTAITVGAAATGSSTLTGSSATAGGAMVYTVYSDNLCTAALTAVNSPSTVTVANKIVPNSAAITFSQAGTAYWRAVYGGDGANNGVSSACVALTVTKTIPTLSLTTTPATTLTAGGSAVGNAVFTGATASAGGTMTYAVYTSSSCSTQVTPNLTSTVNVTNAVAPASDPQTFNVAGSFYWKAVSSGDANNTGVSSPCLLLTVTKTTPALTLTLLAAAITAGTTATGTSTLAGITSVAGGTVVYTVYSNSTCSTTFTVAGSPNTQTVAAGIVPNSVAMPFNLAATYYWKAVYSGDTGNNLANSACVALTVNPTTSTTVGLTTSPSGSVVVLNSAASTATLTGATSVAGGTVAYTVYTDSACTAVYAAANNPNTKAVTNRVAAVSTAITIAVTPPSVVYWQAVYSGDPSNAGGTSPCVALNVIKASPTASLTIVVARTPMKAGGTAYTKAALTSSTATAGGTMAYTVYTNSACTTVYTAAGNPHSKAVVNKTVTSSNSITFGQAGTFYWQGAYSGDANNTAAVSPCTALSVAISTPTITLVPTASKAPMKIGATAYGKVTVSLSTATAGGSLTYTVYTNSVCSTQYTAANNPSTVTVTNKLVPNSTLVTATFVGTLYWKATYTGDVNNAAAASACVALTVAKATPTLTLAVAAVTAPMTINGTAKGSVTMTTAVAAGGSLTYTVYSDATCVTVLTAAGSPSSVTVVNNVVPSSAPITIATVGTVYWKAAYGGDAQNAVASSACVSLAVAKTTPVATLAVNPASPPMRAGGTAAGVVTFTNATADAAGTITYAVYTSNACTTAVTPALTSVKTVANKIAPASDSFTFNTLGTVYWKAAYAGDANNNGVSSACVGLTVVSAAASTLTLTLVPNPAVVGAAVIGDSTLAGTTGTAGGTVTYTVYGNSACTTPVIPAQTSAQTVVNANPPDSAPLAFNVVGTFFWSAVYGGDVNNTSATSACIALPIAKATPALALSLSPNPAEAGASVTGAVAMTGGANAPGGSVTYIVFTNNGCTTQVSPAQTSVKTVVNAVVPNSAAFPFTTAGAFYWKATYGGDTSNASVSSPCVALGVNRATPDLTVAQLPLPVNAGDNFTAHVALSADAVNPSGISTLRYYSDVDCLVAMPGLPAYAATLSGGVIPDAPAFVYAYPDGLFLQATYAGDANNAAVVSDCVSVAIAQDLTLSLTLFPGAAIVHGDSATAQASWPIDEAPTGMVAYAVYGGGGCLGAVVAGPEAKTIAGPTVSASSPVSFPTAGSFSWKASYAGDSAYNPASACTTLTVNATTPVVSLTVSPNPIKAGQTAAGAASLSVSAGSTGGTVAYVVSNGGACAGSLQQNAKTVVNGVAPSSDPLGFAISGVFSWRAAYGGDVNNNPAVSPCVTLIVNRATPALTLVQSPVAVNIGADFTVQLALTADAANPTGSTTLSRYADSGCTAPLAGVAPVSATLSGGLIPDAPALNFNFSGPVYQRATYSGDGNNAPASTACLMVAVNPGALTALVSNAALTPVTYSNLPAGTTGQLVIAIGDGRGTWAGWNVTIASSNFVYGGTSPSGIAIPAAGFTITGGSVPALVSGQPLGSGGPAASPGAVGPLNVARPLAGAAAGFGSGAYSVTVPVALVIPAQSQAGAYTALVTVAISAGP